MSFKSIDNNAINVKCLKIYKIYLCQVFLPTLNNKPMRKDVSKYNFHFIGWEMKAWISK